MDGSEKKRTMLISYDIPHDIVETILSRLPAKSLLRFKSVCKRWSATVSDPKFAQTRLQLQRLSNTSSCIHLLCLDTFNSVGIENNKFRELTMGFNRVGLENYSVVVMCHSCYGLFLLKCRFKLNDKGELLFLWNPSTRTCKKVCCPKEYPFRCNLPFLRSGIFYDPLLEDYKVVIGDEKHYAVYYCKTNSWSGLKEMNINAPVHSCEERHIQYEGVQFKGSIYWLSRSRSEHGDEYRYEIICFDGRDEEFKILHNPDYWMSRGAYLTSSRDSLYFFPSCFYVDRRHLSNDKELMMMKKVGDDDPWMELKVELPFSCPYIAPLCSTQDNRIIFKVSKLKYLLYDYTKRDDTKGVVTRIKTGLNHYRTLYQNLENLLLL